MLLENPVLVPPMACGIMSAGCLRGLDDVYPYAPESIAHPLFTAADETETVRR